MDFSWTLVASLIWAISGTAIGIYALINPPEAGRMFGVNHITNSVKKEPSFDRATRPWIIIFGGRNTAVGLAFFVFHWQGMPKAAGTLWLCLMFSGTVDTFVTGYWGSKDKAWTHGLGTLVMAGIGLVLIQ